MVSIVESCTWVVLGSDMTGDAEPDGVLISCGDGERGVGRDDELDVGSVSTDIEWLVVFRSTMRPNAGVGRQGSSFKTLSLKRMLWREGLCVYKSDLLRCHSW